MNTKIERSKSYKGFLVFLLILLEKRKFNFSKKKIITKYCLLFFSFLETKKAATKKKEEASVRTQIIYLLK